MLNFLNFGEDDCDDQKRLIGLRRVGPKVIYYVVIPWDKVIFETILKTFQGSCVTEQDSEYKIWKECCEVYHFAIGLDSILKFLLLF